MLKKIIKRSFHNTILKMQGYLSFLLAIFNLPLNKLFHRNLRCPHLKDAYKQSEAVIQHKEKEGRGLKKTSLGAGEMTQQSRALADHPEILSSVPSSCIVESPGTSLRDYITVYFSSQAHRHKERPLLSQTGEVHEVLETHPDYWMWKAACHSKIKINCLCIPS